MFQLSRKRKLFLNTITSILYQLLAVLIGFILPKMFLEYYGSEVNGLVASITQFLGFIALMEMGIGAVVQSVLYKPLVDGDKVKISQIVHSSQKFFNKIAFFFVLYIVFLSVFYPLTNSDFGWIYVVGLIIIIAVSSIAQYFFGMTNQLLISADQKIYVSNMISIITLLLNTIISMVFIMQGYSIHTVKLVSASILILRPVLLNIYVKKNYSLISHAKYDKEPISQKWNGIAQHIASFVLNNTDIMVLTVFSTLLDVSIYAVYRIVTNGLQQVIISLTAGIQSLFGHMLANGEIHSLKRRFSRFEWLVHTLVTLLFSCTAVLIVPFIEVYTRGITDANYSQPVFGLLLTIGVGMYCIRLPYNIMVLAAGHYKETQMSAIIEMLLNLVISIVLVSKFGLIGVAVGTLVAMTYRTVYLAYYLPNIIKSYNFNEFLKQMLVDIFSFILILGVSMFILVSNSNYFEWFLSAIIVFIMAMIITIIVNYLFYKENIRKSIPNRFNFRK